MLSYKVRIRGVYKRELIIPLVGISEVMTENREWETSLGDSGKACDFEATHETALRKLEGNYSNCTILSFVARMKFEEGISDTVDEFGIADDRQLPKWLEYIEFELHKVLFSLYVSPKQP